MVTALRLWREEAGAAMIEMTIVMVLLFTLLLGFVDFGYAFYQWNAASKAVQVGARMAAISTPVANSTILSQAATSDPNLVGVTMDPGSYAITCTSTACTGTGSPTFNQASFDRIFYGDRTASGGGAIDCSVASPGRPGMCDFFPGLEPNQVQIEYVATGLGFWTRPGGAVPTIRVSIVNRNFDFFFLSGLLGFTQITMPSMLSTITGEDLSTTF